MPLSTDIKLPKSVTPIFPRRCVFSGIENPDTMAVLMPTKTFTTFGLLFYPALLLFGCRGVRFPICRKYRVAFYAQSIVRDIPALFALLSLPTIGSVCLTVLLILTWAILETFWPRPFTVTRVDNSIEYSFASIAYAAEFKAFNTVVSTHSSPARLQ